MTINQISVFLENRTGQLAEVTTLLSDNGIDLRAISIAETTDYGIARIIVNDSQKASSVLLNNGNIISMSGIWAVEVPDRPAGLSELLSALAESEIDVEYMYSIFTHKDGYAYMALRVSDEDALKEALTKHNLKLATMNDLGLK